jgi:ubiquinol-cytochrome c reductase iron-sulfur subunit
MAMAQLEVDVSSVDVDQTITVKWRGKPVFIKRRSEESIKREEETPLSDLRDPQPDAERRVRPDWLVVVGVCTHLGCVPISNAGDFNGWFCPCHGSHYDGAGRIRKGPGPANLEVPTYKFLEDGKILLG